MHLYNMSLILRFNLHFPVLFSLQRSWGSSLPVLKQVAYNTGGSIHSEITDTFGIKVHVR